MDKKIFYSFISGLCLNEDMHKLRVDVRDVTKATIYLDGRPIGYKSFRITKDSFDDPPLLEISMYVIMDSDKAPDTTTGS